MNVDCQNMGMVCDPLTCTCVPGLPSTTITTVTTTTTTTVMKVVDHLKCYRIKDPQTLSGQVDLDSAQFGLEADCRITKATKFCVPVTKSVDSAAVNGQPFTVVPFPGQTILGDYVCYKIKCTTNVPDTKVRDQFGTRTLTKFKAFELCGPAIKVP